MKRDAVPVSVTRIAFTILGQPQSKANSRQVVTMGGVHSPAKTSMIKSKDALAYERAVLPQIPMLARQQLDGPVRVLMRIWYASERSDLDESLVLDCLQDRFAGKGDTRRLVQKGVYRNDRQVREKHIFHAIDRKNPRVDIVVEPMHPQQLDMLPHPLDEPDQSWNF